MIRMIQRRLIIPRGDTGSFSIPYLRPVEANDIAVFTILDLMTRKKIFQKIVAAEGDNLTIAFSHNDTVNLKPGKYVWDIKIYTDPEFLDDELIGGSKIDSYYAGFSLPECEIRETGDAFLLSEENSSASLTPSQLDFINDALRTIAKNVEKTENNVTHYPFIQDGYWYIWDSAQEEYVNTNINASGGEDKVEALSNNEIDNIINNLQG